MTHDNDYVTGLVYLHLLFLSYTNHFLFDLELTNQILKNYEFSKKGVDSFQMDWSAQGHIVK